jgi:hypothetical protein
LYNPALSGSLRFYGPPLFFGLRNEEMQAVKIRQRKELFCGLRSEKDVARDSGLFEGHRPVHRRG